MAVTFLDPGSDHVQDVTSFYPNQSIGASATATSATDQVHTGNRSIKLATTSGSVSIFTGDTGVCADAGTAVSVWVRFGNLPTLDTSFLGSAATAFGATLIRFVITSGGLVKLYSSGVQIGTAGTTVLATNTWMRISAAWVLTTTANWTVKIWINGTLEKTWTQADATLAAIGTSELGLEASHSPGGGGADTNTHWFDDVYVDNRATLTDPGDIRVTSKRAFSNGTTNGFTTQIGAGSSGYGSGHALQVNEQPLSQTNGWSHVVSGVAITEEYNVENVSTGDVNLTGRTLIDWMGWLVAKSLAGETASIVVGGTNSNISLTSTVTGFYKAKGSTTYPAGTGTDVGIVTATTATTVSLYEAGIMVAYSPAASTGGAQWSMGLVGVQ